MNVQLRKADGHHEKASALYRQIIENAIKESDSVLAVARQAGVPVTSIHDAMKRGAYIAIRNCAHKIKGADK